MPTEFEAKVLDIDPVSITDKILRCGGRLIGDSWMRRYVYDVVRGSPAKWIRLRDTGAEVTLTVKQIDHDGIDGTAETEVTVGDFELANELLKQIGHEPKAYQETRRTSFILADARLEIDQWPLIPPYLEIEGDSRGHVLDVAAMLGLTEADLTAENTIKVYARYGIDLESISDLRFPTVA